MKMILAIFAIVALNGCTGGPLSQSSMKSDTLNSNKVKVFSFWNTETTYNYGVKR